MIVPRARDLWSRLAAVPVAFASAGGVTVVVSPESQLCPPDWAGIVVLDGVGIATAPDDHTADVLRSALDRLPASAATDSARVRAELPVTDVLGPATLAYLDEAGESGLADITSDAFVVRDGDRVVAAAGYHRWVDTAAHVCVLTAPDHRGRGLATAVAAAAVQHAVADGLLPQWRARIEPSRRVARALGFRELGAQLSIKL